MKTKPEYPAGQKGFLMISSYLVLSTMMTLSLALWMRGVNVLSGTDMAVYRMEAFHLAESGLDVAIDSLEGDINYTGAANVPYVKDGRVIGTYDVAVTTPDASNPLRKRVVSTGATTDQDGQGRGLAQRTIVSYIDLIPRKTFDFAVFAEESIDMSGSSTVVVDSYDSSFGPYSSASAMTRADVMTNSTSNAAIELTGNVTVKGDVRVGVGGNPATGIYVGSNSGITGTTSSALANKDYEYEQVPNSAIPMGHVVLDARKTLTLGEGTYVFDSLNMTGKSQLQFTGPATVFLRGEAYIGGNGVTTASDVPKNLMIHVVGPNTLTYAGNGNLHAGIYAPESHVDVSGNGSVMGGVVARTYYQHGSGHFHYDEDLKNQDPNARLRAEMVSWQEQNKQAG